ncbi:GntR family transcriptional regulator [Roseomonas sp. 18066]|uniref:GntR family transcriptional regulator n=1 Tax=Roseomonas sp. 18066 TaxID=2681412 RepID=UPI0013581417|nr:GntR family transcriptional regulator [Roseomonas sp. 18066]
MPGPIARRSLQDEATDWLRQEILQGRLPPAATLTETALSQRMEVGRGTVRSALFALEAAELVGRLPYSRWHVVPLDAAVIAEVYTLRGALEELAARLFAARPDRARLQPAFDRLAAAGQGDLEARLAADLGYHRAVVEATGHGHLIRGHRALSDKMEWLYRWSERHWPQRTRLVEDHAVLHAALTAGTPEAAEAATRAHIATSLRQDLEGFALLAGGSKEA